ncbi:MAG: hypothetical protein HKL87_07515 [Acidimicrobiaceae bacterium]|nr:hypothetical protein [Acidimicrobiaceae bacterium]
MGQAGSLVALVAIIAIGILVRRSRAKSPGLGRGLSRSERLVRGERRRPLLITLLDGVIALVVIGPTVWRVARVDGSTLTAALVGVVVGVVVGALRARVMLVGRVAGTRDVILRRSPLEYGLLVVLIVARSFENSARTATSSWALPVFTALVTLALVESLSRALFIAERFWRGPAVAPTYGTDVVEGSTSE